MDETTFQTKLAELMKEISSLPKAERDKLTAMAHDTQTRHAKLQKRCTTCRKAWITCGCRSSTWFSTLKRPGVKIPTCGKWSNRTVPTKTLISNNQLAGFFGFIGFN